MVVIEFQELHFVFAVRTFKRIIAEGRKNGDSPLMKTAEYRMLFSCDSTVKMFIYCTVACVESTIPNHLEMFFRYVADQTFDKVYSRNGFLNIFVIFMAIVMKGNHFTIVFANSGLAMTGRPRYRPIYLTTVLGSHLFGLA